jgi:hypothetical protein
MTDTLPRRPAPDRTGALPDLAAVRAAPWRRKLQVALGLMWLLDAGLQLQPYMFSTSFVQQVILPNNLDTPWIVAHPAVWLSDLMAPHPAPFDAGFALVQLGIALAILHRPTARIGLAVSVGWALGVWVLGEGLGQISNAASPVMGAPGAAVLYAYAAVLLWPRRAGRGAADHDHEHDPIAYRGPLGAVVPRVLWAALWLGLAQLALDRVNRSPSGLFGVVDMMQAGEPAWLRAVDRSLAAPLAHHGTEASLALAAVLAVIAVGAVIPRTARATLVLAVAFAAVAWVAQDFGGIFTGRGTDPNTGPLLVLLAAVYWPRAGRHPRHARPDGDYAAPTLST